MRKALLLVLSFSGLSVLFTNHVSDYHHVKTLKTWAEAQSYCREKFTDLATVVNQDNNSRLLSAIQDASNLPWIGLYDDQVGWKWALGNVNFSVTADFHNWDPGDSYNRDFNETCVVLTTDGFWRDKSCLVKHHVVCFDEQDPSNYVIEKKDMTWYDARDFCRSKHTDLASVRNKSENHHITSLIEHDSWIGLHRRTWPVWSDQTPANYSNWMKGEPNYSGNNLTSCAVFDTTTGTWLNVDCEEEHYFVCEDVYHQTVSSQRTLKLKFQSEADLNDPDIQRQILDQLHAKLGASEMPDFKLRWIQKDGQTFHKKQNKNQEQGSG